MTVARWMMWFCAWTVPKGLSATDLDRAAVHGEAAVEWSIRAEAVAGNRFDAVAEVTFTHRETGETRRTEMFHVPPDRWNFRFYPLLPGTWSFGTRSDLTPLHGIEGKVLVATREREKPSPRHYISNAGNRWVWSGGGKPMVPRLVMYRSPDGYFRQPERIDDDLKTWFTDHGFNGLHTAVLCRWFDLDQSSSDMIASEDPNPDPRTFEALELLIGKAHAAGGFVHIWAWGDESRRMTPARWGINGKADQRLQRHLAARLGPLPGWTMGYGFDLWEWVDGEQLAMWHDFLQQRFFHAHLIGGRVHQHGRPLDTELTRRLSYMGYESHRPDFATYRQALLRNPETPVMMEDRFRVRESATHRHKDYNMEMTRRGMYHAAFAGGVANIWGYLLPDEGPHGMSMPYPNQDELKTHAEFLDRRFTADLSPIDQGPGIMAMATADRSRWLIYTEDADQVPLRLATMPGSRPAVAVDTRRAYHEIPLGRLDPSDQMWDAPHHSDWAIAIGDPMP